MSSITSVSGIMGYQPNQRIITVKMGNFERRIPLETLVQRHAKFTTMFQGNFIEKDSVNLAAPEGITPEAISDFLDYLETNKVNLNGENCLWLIILARQEEQSSLVSECSHFLSDNLDADNAAAIYHFAKEHKFHSLSDICMTYLEKNVNSENVVDWILLAQEHNYSSLRNCCETYMKYDAPSVKKVLQIAVDRNFRDLKWMCLYIIYYICTRYDLSSFNIQDLSPEAREIWELGASIESNFEFQFRLSHSWKRIFSFDASRPSDKAIACVAKIHSVMGIEYFKLRYVVSDEAALKLASIVPTLQTLRYSSNLSNIPESWGNSVKKFSSVGDIQVINLHLPKAEEVKCRSAFNCLTTIVVPVALRVELIYCHELETIYAPQAKVIKAIGCRALKQITIANDCVIEGDLPPTCEITREK